MNGTLSITDSNFVKVSITSSIFNEGYTAHKSFLVMTQNVFIDCYINKYFNGVYSPDDFAIGNNKFYDCKISNFSYFSTIKVKPSTIPISHPYGCNGRSLRASFIIESGEYVYNQLLLMHAAMIK